MFTKRSRSKKAATAEPQITGEPSQEDSGAPLAAAHGVFPPAKTPTPESHPHLFDDFGNPK